jgi:slit protein 2
MQIILIINITKISTSTSGIDGKKCEKLSTISIHDTDAYSQFVGLEYQPSINLTFVISTHTEEGIIFYHGFDKHVAIEIFRSRIRVSFDIGNYPVSTMFSYEQINDNKTHVVQFIISGKNMSMQIDKGVVRTIRNEGEKAQMVLEEEYYIGGLPPDVSAGALKKWHLRATRSLSG